MSVQISCTICGAQSPTTVDTDPAVAWSRAHRCGAAKVIELAKERATVTRLGKMLARETDRDLVIMRELVALLEMVSVRNALDMDTVDDDSEFHQGIRHSATAISEILDAREVDPWAPTD